MDTYCDNTTVGFLKPFNFEADFGNCVCDNMECGWPATNFAFRLVISLLGILSSVHLGLYYYGLFTRWLPIHWGCLLLLAFVYAVCYFCIFTLDANATRVGNAFCEDDFQFDGAVGSFGSNISCRPGKFVGTCLGDMILALLVNVVVSSPRGID
eukprot:UN02779